MATNSADFPTFEQLLSQDSRCAVSEGSLFFEGKGAVQETLHRITSHLNELGIPYAVVGGMALFQYGFRRFTEDVDILVTREGLNAIHKSLDGLGYVRPFEKSKNLRDANSKVKIEFLISGDFPGDGKPKPVSFPKPQDVSNEIDGIQYLKMATLVELKLASGMTGSDRMKDLSDVQELIKVLDLPNNFRDSLHETVREKYLELWESVHAKPKRYVRLWRNKLLTVDVKSLEEMISIFRAASSELEAMLEDGVVLDADGGTADDYAYLVTTDPKIAKKHGMEDESEFWDGDDLEETTEKAE